MARFLLQGRLSSTVVTSALVILATAAAVNFNGSSYSRNASLDENMDVFWNIDTNLDMIRVAVHAKAATGWAGFGVSEMGGMEGADIVFYEVSVSQVQYFLFGSHSNLVTLTLAATDLLQLSYFPLYVRTVIPTFSINSAFNTNTTHKRDQRVHVACSSKCRRKGECNKTAVLVQYIEVVQDADCLLRVSECGWKREGEYLERTQQTVELR